MEIRRAALDDADAILRFWTDSDATVSPTDRRDDVRGAIEHPGVAFLVAVDDKRIVGSVLGAFDGWRGNIYRLVVSPTHRRKGIARALVRQVEVLFTAWHVKRVTALVEKDHLPATGFWNAVGYAPDDRMQRHVRTL